MDQETKDLLLKYLQAGADRIERGTAFVEAEIPLVVTEYLNWYWWSSLFFIVIGISLLLVALIPVRYVKSAYSAACKSYFWTNGGGEVIPPATLVLLSIGISIGGFCTVCTQSYNCLKVSVAPRVVLLEKIAEIAK